MTRATKDHLMKKADRRDTVVLPDGSDVLIRGLSRAEVLRLNDFETLAEKDTFILAAGMVDPAITLEEAAAWRDAEGSMAAIELVQEAINAASGMGEAAGKTARKSPARRR